MNPIPLPAYDSADDTAPAEGICNGLAIAVLLWLAVGLAWWLL